MTGRNSMGQQTQIHPTAVVDPGAVLGALVMQSLISGMALMGVEAPYKNIVVGIVLVSAVALDSFYQRRVSS